MNKSLMIKGSLVMQFSSPTMFWTGFNPQNITEQPKTNAYMTHLIETWQKISAKYKLLICKGIDRNFCDWFKSKTSPKRFTNKDKNHNIKHLIK